MCVILSPVELQCTLVYLNDIFVFSRLLCDHIEKVKGVFSFLQDDEGTLK